MTKQETPQKNTRSGRTTQIVVAIITTLGILGTAIIGNWDKIFPKKSYSVIGGGVKGNAGHATEIADKQQQVGPVEISGAWKTSVMKSPFAENVFYSLVFQFEIVGDRVFGTVRTIDRQSGRGSTLGIKQGRVEGKVVTFITQSAYTNGQELIPYQTEYHGIIRQDLIKFIRQNNVPSGEIPEEFIASRE